MTYTPIPETTVSTPFGELRLIVNSGTVAQIMANAPDEGKITVNGVAYTGRIEFEKVDGGWGIKRRDNGAGHVYIDGVSLKRANDWRTGLSDAARRKLVHYFDGEFCHVLDTSPTVNNLTGDADLRNAQAAVETARETVKRLQAELGKAEEEWLDAIENLRHVQARTKGEK